MKLWNFPWNRNSSISFWISGNNILFGPFYIFLRLPEVPWEPGSLTSWETGSSSCQEDMNLEAGSFLASRHPALHQPTSWTAEEPQDPRNMGSPAAWQVACWSLVGELEGSQVSFETCLAGMDLPEIWLVSVGISLKLRYSHGMFHFQIIIIFWWKTFRRKNSNRLYCCCPYIRKQTRV